MANTFSSKKWERKKIVYLLASYFKCCFPNREQLWRFQTLCIISGLVKSILKLWNLTPSSAISSPHPFPQIHLPHLLSLKDFGFLSPRVLSFRLLLTCVYSAEAHGLASPTQHMLHKKGIKDVSCWCIPMAWHRVWAYWLFISFWSSFILMTYILWSTYSVPGVLLGIDRVVHGIRKLVVLMGRGRATTEPENNSLPCSWGVA